MMCQRLNRQAELLPGQKYYLASLEVLNLLNLAFGKPFTSSGNLGNSDLALLFGPNKI